VYACEEEVGALWSKTFFVHHVYACEEEVGKLQPPG